MTLAIDHRTDPAGWAAQLGIDEDSVRLYLDAEVVDLHNDLYVPARLYGYNPHKRHSLGWRGGYYFGQSDLPRIREARLGGVVFDIATNPSRRGKRRAPVTHRNIARIREDLETYPEDYQLVTRYSEYRAARDAGKIACYLGIQGGQAFQHDRDALESIPDEIHRITLVHLTNSRIGSTSSPLGPDRGGLTELGRELVEVMDAKRCLVDLAHINEAGFWDAIDAHDKSLPVACTHTGVDGVHPHWRNLTDDQVRAVVDTGGVVGIVFHGNFLDGSPFRCPPDAVIAHMEHVIKIGGEHAVAIGTDYDGFIVPPKRLEEVTCLPVLVQLMRDRGWSERRIRGALGTNALRMFEGIRP